MPKLLPTGSNFNFCIYRPQVDEDDEDGGEKDGEAGYCPLGRPGRHWGRAPRVRLHGGQDRPSLFNGSLTMNREP